MSLVQVLDDILARAARDPRRIVLPEAGDERILRAAVELAAAGVCHPVLVGPAAEVRASMDAAGLRPERVEIVDPATSPARGVVRGALADALARREPTAEEIDARLAEPLYWANAMVRAGLADGSVAGAATSTADTVRAALRVLGTAPDVRLVSSYFLMALRRPTAAGDEVLAFADCAMIPDPDPAGLVQIARATAAQLRAVCGVEPRVAFLSFSTYGSAEHPRVDKVRAAVAELRRSGAPFAFDGDLQLDAALVPEIAARKAPESEVAGRANVLVFPDLDAGNIGYKLVQRLAGATAVGPLLQGLSRPATDLSRGASVSEIVLAAAVTSLQSRGA